MRHAARRPKLTDSIKTHRKEKVKCALEGAEILRENIVDLIMMMAFNSPNEEHLFMFMRDVELVMDILKRKERSL